MAKIVKLNVYEKTVYAVQVEDKSFALSYQLSLRTKAYA